MSTCAKWAEEQIARRDRTATNIDELFECLLAGTSLQCGNPFPVSMVSKLPDVLQEDRIYLSINDTEPTVVVCSKRKGANIAVSESFVRACFEGKHGDRENSVEILNDMLGDAIGLIHDTGLYAIEY